MYHDTFNLACTSKYYEDAGYFGHKNCSDNLNEVMEKYGVQKKRGWHAINLFFNTSAGGQNSVLSDESFARPGDYVIFKALKDLTCVQLLVLVILIAVMDGIQQIYLLELMTKKKNLLNLLLLE